MLVKQGSFVCNGERRFVDLGFRPLAVIAKSDAPQYAAFWLPDMWCGRSNVLGQSSSYISGICATDSGFIVGSAAALNSDGVTTHYIAIGDDGYGDVEVQSWAGDGVAGHEILLQSGLTPIAAMVKRDGPRQAALKLAGVATVAMQGGTITDAIALGAGKVTLDASVEVNEWDSAGGLGEGIDGLFIAQSDNCRVVIWAGDGTIGRVIQTGVENVACAVISNPATGGSSRVVTASMSGKVGPVTNGAALLSNEASLSGSTIVLGNASPLNVAGQIYGAVVWAEKVAAQPKAPAVIKQRGKQAVLLTGETGSYIHCGTSDATLLIDGAITYEWFGAHQHNVTASKILDGQIIARGNGSYGNPGGYSWSLVLGSPDDGSLGWGGPQYCPQTHNLMGLSVPLNTNNWRTGILAPFGELQHVVASIGADGNCYMMVNGVLVKQRKNANAVIDSVSGHPTVIGGRSSSGSVVRNTRLIMREVSIYNRALTLDEAYNRYMRAALGSKSASDVTSGLAERWSADNAGTSKLKAVVSAANDGTIAGGQIIQL